MFTINLEFPEHAIAANGDDTGESDAISISHQAIAKPGCDSLGRLGCRDGALRTLWSGYILHDLGTFECRNCLYLGVFYRRRRFVEQTNLPLGSKTKLEIMYLRRPYIKETFLYEVVEEYMSKSVFKPGKLDVSPDFCYSM